MSSWKICRVGTPLAFQTIQVSTVVAAHWMSPEAIARCRSFCGIFLIVTSSPLRSKIPACFASVSGANPVHPLIPIPTSTGSAARAAPLPSASHKAASNPIPRIRLIAILFLLPAAPPQC